MLSVVDVPTAPECPRVFPRRRGRVRQWRILGCICFRCFLLLWLGLKLKQQNKKYTWPYVDLSLGLSSARDLVPLALLRFNTLREEGLGLCVCGEGCVPYFRLEILESDILRGGPYLYGLGKVRFLLGRGGGWAGAFCIVSSIVLTLPLRPAKEKHNPSQKIT